GRKGHTVTVARAGKAVPAHGEGLRLAAVLLDPERDMLCAVLALRVGRANHGLSRRDRAMGRFAGKLPRMEYATGNGFQKISPTLQNSCPQSHSRAAAWYRFYSIAQTPCKVNKKRPAKAVPDGLRCAFTGFLLRQRVRHAAP